MPKTYQAQIIFGKWENGKLASVQGIIWHCDHDHATRQKARDCLRNIQPDIFERVVESEADSHPGHLQTYKRDSNQ